MCVRPSFPYWLYLVISEADCRGRNFLEVAEEAIAGGVDIIQLREKNSAVSNFLKRAQQLKVITDRYHVPLIINDHISVSEQVNAAGVHVGNNDEAPLVVRRRKLFQDKIVGYSIEYISQLYSRQIAAADYLGISPVFKTDTKKDTVTQWGLAGIANIRKLTDKPLVAIGGINVGNAAAVMNAGADCIAVVSEICGAADPREAARQLRNEIADRTK